MTRIKAYVISLSVLAVFATVVAYRLSPIVSSALVKAALCFAVLGAICEILAFKKAGRSESGSMAFLPYLAAVVVAPSWISVVAIASTTVGVELANRRAFIKGVFNVAQTALGLSLAVTTYHLLGGTSLLGASLGIQLIPFVSVLLVIAIINPAALSGAIALSEGQSFFKLWISRAKVTFVYDLCTLPFVFVFAWFYVQFGPIGSIVLVVPLLGVREVYKVNWQLQRSNQELLELMVAAIEARDPYTSGHSRRVSRNSRLIARAIGLREKQIERVTVAALLHDVGKIHEVFAPILSKPGRLTAAENAIMQTHPIKSAELVSNVSQLKDVIAPIRHHHENWDGTGYPDGLVGEAIPLASRIIMFADTIDAMTTDRPYRSALTETQVRAEFVKLRGRQFDPSICDHLLNNPVYERLFDQDVPLTPAIANHERLKTPHPAPRLVG